jgi:hypothetical protein
MFKTKEFKPQISLDLYDITEENIKNLGYFMIIFYDKEKKIYEIEDFAQYHSKDEILRYSYPLSDLKPYKGTLEELIKETRENDWRKFYIMKGSFTDKDIKNEKRPIKYDLKNWFENPEILEKFILRKTTENEITLLTNGLELTLKDDGTYILSDPK